MSPSARSLKWGCALVMALGALQVSAAGTAANHKLRFDFHLGNSYQNFAGVSGADFSKIDRISYSAAFFYRFKKYFDAGFQYSSLASVTVSPFIFTDNIVGSYVGKFTQYELMLGLVVKKYRFHLLGGYEHLALIGTPALTYGWGLKPYYGFQFSRDMFARHKIRIPLFLRFLKKGRRLWQFENKPDDPIDVTAGNEIVVGTGADFEFK